MSYVCIVCVIYRIIISKRSSIFVAVNKLSWYPWSSPRRGRSQNAGGAVVVAVVCSGGRGHYLISITIIYCCILNQIIICSIEDIIISCNVY